MKVANIFYLSIKNIRFFGIENIFTVTKNIFCVTVCGQYVFWYKLHTYSFSEGEIEIVGIDICNISRLSIKLCNLLSFLIIAKSNIKLSKIFLRNFVYINI